MPCRSLALTFAVGLNSALQDLKSENRLVATPLLGTTSSVNSRCRMLPSAPRMSETFSSNSARDVISAFASE